MEIVEKFLPPAKLFSVNRAFAAVVAQTKGIKVVFTTTGAIWFLGRARSEFPFLKARIVLQDFPL